MLTSLGLEELLEQGWGRGGPSEEGPCSVSEPVCVGSSFGESCLCLPRRRPPLGLLLQVGRGWRGPRQENICMFLWTWGWRGC